MLLLGILQCFYGIVDVVNDQHGRLLLGGFLLVGIDEGRSTEGEADGESGTQDTCQKTLHERCEGLLFFLVAHSHALNQPLDEEPYYWNQQGRKVVEGFAVLYVKDGQAR